MFNFNFLKKNISLKKTSAIQYIKPEINCSNLILLSGPAYGDKTFFGSFLLDVSASKAWMKEHSNTVFSSAKLEQDARVFLPNWCSNVTKDDDTYVTLIDIQMRHVLVPYTYDFYLKDCLRIYCYQCHSYCDKILDNSSDVVSIGNNRSWVEEWHCSNGHVLHRKSQELRLLIRQN
jgi:hypothetical protein